jgi:hypothetical protein
VERHRDERGRLVLAGCQEHVQLARVGVVSDGGGEGEELVGGVPHCRDDHHQSAPRGPLPGNATGYAANPVGIGDGRTAVLLDDEG